MTASARRVRRQQLALSPNAAVLAEYTREARADYKRRARPHSCAPYRAQDPTMRFARREGVPQPWRGSGYSYALSRPRGTPLWALQITYLPRPSPVGCTRAHGLVTGDYTVTIRWQAQRQRARLPSEEMLTTEPACAVTPTHAPQRSTAQRCSSVTTAPLRQLHCRPAALTWLCAQWHNIRPVQHRIASHRMGNGVRCVQGRRRTTAQADARRRAAGRAVLSLPHADAWGVHSREACGQGWRLV